MANHLGSSELKPEDSKDCCSLFYMGVKMRGFEYCP